MNLRNETSHGLPLPDDDSARHSEAVVAHITALIAGAGGSISFAEYMQEVLYAPGLGYYAAGATKLGADGDFVTAPEISSYFGYVLARQSAFVLEQLGGGDVLEPGAGSGALAISLLTKLAELRALPHRYLILEVSADLRERQEQRLRKEIPQFIDRVEWIAELPQQFSGVVIANEVADAIPVERFAIRDGKVQQARIGKGDDGFVWLYQPAPRVIVNAVREIESGIGRELEDGFESEIAMGLSNWIGDLSRSVARGMIFLIDYGVTCREYYAPDRDTGWLRCHFRHFAHHDPLILPGIQDLTAWVDFTAVAESAANAGMDVAGFTTQASFLMSGGLEEELHEFVNLPIERQVELSGQIKILTLPAEMGENFKCIGLSRGDIVTPPAFRGSDRAHLL